MGLSVLALQQPTNKSFPNTGLTKPDNSGLTESVASDCIPRQQAIHAPHSGKRPSWARKTWPLAARSRKIIAKATGSVVKTATLSAVKTAWLALKSAPAAVVLAGSVQAMRMPQLVEKAVKKQISSQISSWFGPKTTLAAIGATTALTHIRIHGVEGAMAGMKNTVLAAIGATSALTHMRIHGVEGAMAGMKNTVTQELGKITKPFDKVLEPLTDINKHTSNCHSKTLTSISRIVTRLVNLLNKVDKIPDQVRATFESGKTNTFKQLATRIGGVQGAIDEMKKVAAELVTPVLKAVSGGGLDRAKSIFVLASSLDQTRATIRATRATIRAMGNNIKDLRLDNIALTKAVTAWGNSSALLVTKFKDMQTLVQAIGNGVRQNTLDLQTIFGSVEGVRGFLEGNMSHHLKVVKESVIGLPQNILHLTQGVGDLSLSTGLVHQKVKEMTDLQKNKLFQILLQLTKNTHKLTEKAQQLAAALKNGGVSSLTEENFLSDVFR